MQVSKDTYVVVVSGSFVSRGTIGSEVRPYCVFNNVPLICPFPVRKLTITMATCNGKTGSASTAVPVSYGLIMYLMSDKLPKPLIMAMPTQNSKMVWKFDVPKWFTEPHNLQLYASDTTTVAAANRGYAPLVPYQVCEFTATSNQFQDVGIMFTFEA